jgi:hypothetical protein
MTAMSVDLLDECDAILAALRPLDAVRARVERALRESDWGDDWPHRAAECLRAAGAEVKAPLRLYDRRTLISVLRNAPPVRRLLHSVSANDMQRLAMLANVGHHQKVHNARYGDARRVSGWVERIVADIDAATSKRPPSQSVMGGQRAGNDTRPHVHPDHSNEDVVDEVAPVEQRLNERQVPADPFSAEAASTTNVRRFGRNPWARSAYSFSTPLRRAEERIAAEGGPWNYEWDSLTGLAERLGVTVGALWRWLLPKMEGNVHSVIPDAHLTLAKKEIILVSELPLPRFVSRKTIRSALGVSGACWDDTPAVFWSDAEPVISVFARESDLKRLLARLWLRKAPASMASSPGE